MCGIAGLIDVDRARAETAINVMMAAQQHRGPDGEGVEVIPFGRAFLALGHRRLSILDLSPSGRQPMRDPASGNVLVFNGEIYNFAELKAELVSDGTSFRSTGDSEVLLQALTHWGVAKTLHRLQGMFAFAFFEPLTGTLWLARDPLGIKPLYLAETAGGGLAFASEVRSLLASGLIAPQFDRRGIAGFLAYGAVQHPFTLFEGIRSLPPGAVQKITATDSGWRLSEPEEFWNFPEAGTDFNAENAVASVREHVDEAIRDHLVADVPVGVFLSGGLDSTVIAGVAAKYSPHIQGFTVGFSDNLNLSEMHLAAATAKQFGLRHVPLNVTGSAAESGALEWLEAVDQPSIDGLNTFLISRAVRQEGIKVALSGLGADELFGGYPSFRDLPRLMRLRRRIGWLPSNARRSLAQVLTVHKPRVVRQKFSDLLSGTSRITELYFRRRRLLSDHDLGRLGFESDSLGLTHEYRQADAISQDFPSDPIRAVSELESRFYQGNMLLRDSDVMGMAHGLEIRVPFLDRRVLDLVHAIPGKIRLPPGAPGKVLLRKAFGDLLRPELTNRAKTGFTLPLGQWMLGPLRDVCDQGLATLKTTGLMSAPGVDAIWNRFLAAPASEGCSRALALVALGDYVRRLKA